MSKLHANWTSIVCHQPALQTHTHTLISARIGISPPFSLKVSTQTACQQTHRRNLFVQHMFTNCANHWSSCPWHTWCWFYTTKQWSDLLCFGAKLHPGVTASSLVYHTGSKTFQIYFSGKWLQRWMPVRAGLGPTPLNHENHLFWVSVIFIWTIRQHGSKMNCQLSKVHWFSKNTLRH